MANIQSQIKRNRQNERRRLRNKAVRTRLRSEAKKARILADEGELQAAQERLRATARDLDKAAAKGILHPRTAARRKSRLARQIAAGASPETE